MAVDPALIPILVELVADLDKAGVADLKAEGDRLRWKPATLMLPAELLARLKQHKADLVAVLRREDPAAQPEADATAEAAAAPDGREADRGDVACMAAPPCARCGSSLLWWDVLGGRHCMVCDPVSARAKRFGDKAAAIHQRWRKNPTSLQRK